MNQVYISGIIAGNPVLRMEKGTTPHLLFYVDIQHKTRAGQVRHEQYRCNAWRNIALRGAQSLQEGQMVMLRGYLTQRAVQVGEVAYSQTEVTAEEFVLSNSLQKPACPIRQDTIASPAPVAESDAEKAGDTADKSPESTTEDAAQETVKTTVEEVSLTEAEISTDEEFIIEGKEGP